MHTGQLEGINNRIKVIKRMAYGYRDTDYFFLKTIPPQQPLPMASPLWQGGFAINENDSYLLVHICAVLLPSIKHRLSNSTTQDT